MIGDIMQPTHLLFVLVVALLVLGPKRLPEVGRQLGKGIRDFRAAINGEHHDEISAEPPNAPVRSELHHEAAQPGDHQFAHADVETVPEEHQFAHEAAEPAAGEHRQAHAGAERDREAAHETPVQAPGHEVDAGATRPAGEHEFAYEPAQPAEKPVDRLT